MSERTYAQLVQEYVPEHDHISWCRAHQNEGFYDQRCRTEDRHIILAESGADEQICASIRVEQYFARTRSNIDWTIEKPAVSLTTWRGTDPETIVELTPAEARIIAGRLLDAAELAESDARRCYP